MCVRAADTDIAGKFIISSSVADPDLQSCWLLDPGPEKAKSEI
jgi:hypothetical protein